MNDYLNQLKLAPSN